MKRITRIGLQVVLLSGAAATSTFAQQATTAPAAAPAQQRPAAGARGVRLPDTVEVRQVTIWSDGTRMIGDLYLPKARGADEKLPAVLFCAGTGGTRRGSPQRMAPMFTDAGLAFLAFDYRGWGDSDSQLMALDAQPKPDAKGEMTIPVRAVRWQMSYTDQTEDIRAALSFLAGDPAVDASRLGLVGTSYGGGLVTWVAGNDPRVKAVVAQVAGMGGARTPEAAARGYDLLTKQARGDTEPVPFETGKLTGNMASYENMRSNPAKSIGFSAVEAAQKINVPMLIIDAEKDELINIPQNGQRVAEILKERGIPVTHRILPGTTHYSVYRESFNEATKMQVDFFKEHLAKGPSK